MMNQNEKKVTGTKGAVTGRLHWDPLVYPCKDGSRNCLFQLDVIYRAGAADPAQPEGTARLDVHILPQDVENSPYLKLRKGQLVSVEYVMQTNTYQDAEGRTVSKTHLMAQHIRIHREGRRPARRPGAQEANRLPRNGPAAGGPDRRGREYRSFRPDSRRKEMSALWN